MPYKSSYKTSGSGYMGRPGPVKNKSSVFGSKDKAAKQYAHTDHPSKAISGPPGRGSMNGTPMSRRV